MSLYDIPYRVLVRAQFISRTRDSPQEILTLLVAVRIVGTLFQRIEHIGARGALVHQRAIAVILEEVTAIEYRQGDGRVKVRRRGNIAEYVTVRLLLPMTIGLLEAELDEEPEELPRVECTGDVRGAHVVRLQRQTEQPQRAQNARQLSTSCHFSARTSCCLPFSSSARVLVATRAVKSRRRRTPSAFFRTISRTSTSTAVTARRRHATQILDDRPPARQCFPHRDATRSPRHFRRCDILVSSSSCSPPTTDPR